MGSSTSKSVPSKRLDGKTAIITGSNTGIGKITARELYRSGARVIMACRDLERASAAVADIKIGVQDEEGVGQLLIKELDLSSFDSIRKCADDINNSEENIHFLINNAGVMCPKGKTEDGFETHFGVNHLGHFLFTCLLLRKLIKSAPSKIITVSSVAHERGEIVWDDINYEKRSFSTFSAYSQSKLANVLFTKELAKKIEGSGVTAFSLHPGMVKTEMGRHFDAIYFRGAKTMATLIAIPFSYFILTPDEGAKTTLYAIFAENDEENGSYYSDCRLKKPSERAQSDEDAKKLWEESSKMVNLDFDPFEHD